MNSEQATQAMKRIFERGSVATKEVKVFGRHCLITCLCHESAIKVGRLLQAAGWKVNGPVRSYDLAACNPNGGYGAKRIEVYRIGGRLVG